ncbi:MAG: hypothetical protein ACE37H_13835 [Phycisphaeraceae bacterium]
MRNKIINMLWSRIIKLESHVRELQEERASRLPSRGSVTEPERSEAADSRDGGRLSPETAGA